MEAIAGIVYPDAFQIDGSIHRMLETLNHRCGQKCEIQTHRNIEIGICGNSFAHNSKKTLFLAVDGDINNIDEIRTKLKRKGFLNSEIKPADILLNAYLCWGMKFLEKLNGNFSIVIVDQQKQHIVLARDRIGKKPLYWYHEHNTFIFGSELKALMSSNKIPQTPALDSLASYLYFGFIPQDMSPIENVNKLLPAHYLQYHFDGSLYIHNYWSYSSYFENKVEAPKTEIALHLEELLSKSIQKQLNSETPLGCFISGGLGSASIALYMSKFMNHNNIYGFTSNYQGENDLDVQIAKDVSKALNIHQETYTLNQNNLLNDFVNIAWHLEEPNADPTLIGTWNLAKLAKSKVQTIFSGMGSDEFLAGHSRYTITEQRLSTFIKMMKKTLPIFHTLLIPIFKVLYRKFAFQLLKSSRTNIDQYEFLTHKSQFSEKEISFASPKLAGIFDPEVFLHKFHHLSKVHSNIDSFLYFDVKTSLPDNYMLQYDRLISAHSLEWKAPFLDREIIEYLASIPNPEDLVEEEAASYLKAIVKEDLPKIVTERAKRTRRYFLCNWVVRDPICKQIYKLSKGILVETGLIEKGWLNEKLEQIGENPETCKQLWTIFMLEVWYRLYINRSIETHAPNITLDELLES